MADWRDTLLNVNVFAFIGLLIWLMIKPVDPIRPTGDSERSRLGGEDSAGDTD